MAYYTTQSACLCAYIQRVIGLTAIRRYIIGKINAGAWRRSTHSREKF